MEHTGDILAQRSFIVSDFNNVAIGFSNKIQERLNASSMGLKGLDLLREKHKKMVDELKQFVKFSPIVNEGSNTSVNLNAIRPSLIPSPQVSSQIVTSSNAKCPPSPCPSSFSHRSSLSMDSGCLSLASTADAHFLNYFQTTTQQQPMLNLDALPTTFGFSLPSSRKNSNTAVTSFIPPNAFGATSYNSATRPNRQTYQQRLSSKCYDTETTVSETTRTAHMLFPPKVVQNRIPSNDQTASVNQSHIKIQSQHGQIKQHGQKLLTTVNDALKHHYYEYPKTETRREPKKTIANHSRKSGAACLSFIPAIRGENQHNDSSIKSAIKSNQNLHQTVEDLHAFEHMISYQKKNGRSLSQEPAQHFVQTKSQNNEGLFKAKMLKVDKNHCHDQRDNRSMILEPVYKASQIYIQPKTLAVATKPPDTDFISKKSHGEESNSVTPSQSPKSSTLTRQYAMRRIRPSSIAVPHFDESVAFKDFSACDGENSVFHVKKFGNGNSSENCTSSLDWNMVKKLLDPHFDRRKITTTRHQSSCDVSLMDKPTSIARAGKFSTSSFNAEATAASSTTSGTNTPMTQKKKATCGVMSNGPTSTSSNSWSPKNRPRRSPSICSSNASTTIAGSNDHHGGVSRTGSIQSTDSVKSARRKEKTWFESERL